MKTITPFVAASLFTALVGGACTPGDNDPKGDPREIAIPFVARVGDEPFACGDSFAGIGKDAVTITPADLRFYVHGVTVIDDAGNDVAVTLIDDVFQKDGAALLDFEDGTGACDTGSPDVNTAIRGTIPADTTMTAVRFTVGLPERQNHLDATVAEAPFNIPSMWWAWASGYKFMKIEAVNDADDITYFHQGSTGCDGTPADGFACTYANRATIELALTAAQDIAIDIKPLFAGVDVAAPLAEGNGLRGCMSFGGDPDCASMFGAVGITYEDGEGTPTQSVFSATSR